MNLEYFPGVPASTKPYMVQSMYQWCVDNNFTPYIQVQVNESTHELMQLVNNDQISINISMQALPDLVIDNQTVYFTSRFKGKNKRITIPMQNITAIFSKECERGVLFGFEEQDASRKEYADLITQPVKTTKFSIVK